MNNIEAFLEVASLNIEEDQQMPSFVVTALHEGGYRASIEFVGNTSPFPLTGCDGEREMSAEGPTLADAVAQLEAICAEDLATEAGYISSLMVEAEHCSSSTRYQEIKAELARHGWVPA